MTAAFSVDEEVRGGYPDASILALPGFERVRAGYRGLSPAPPIHHLFGLRPVSATSVSAAFLMPATPWLQTEAGVFFAGTAALVADAALGSAVLAPLGPGKIVVTSDLSFNFLRPMDVSSGQLVARARPIEVGSRLGLAEATIEDAQGRTVAHSTTRCFVLSLPVPDDPGQPQPFEAPRHDTPDPHERPAPPIHITKEMWEQRRFAELVNAQAAGELPQPPFAQLLGIHGWVAEEGRFSERLRCTRWLTSPAGTIYGGVLAYFLDTALTGAISTVLERNEIASPLDLKVQFFRPVMPDGNDVHADATVVHRGRGFAAAEARLSNSDGKLVAIATSSAAIISGRSWGSFIVADEAPAPPETPGD